MCAATPAHILLIPERMQLLIDTSTSWVLEPADKSPAQEGHPGCAQSAEAVAERKTTRLPVGSQMCSMQASIDKSPCQANSPSSTAGMALYLARGLSEGPPARITPCTLQDHYGLQQASAGLMQQRAGHQGCMAATQT